MPKYSLSLSDHITPMPLLGPFSNWPFYLDSFGSFENVGIKYFKGNMRVTFLQSGMLPGFFQTQ